jgi:hypothetical protein
MRASRQAPGGLSQRTSRRSTARPSAYACLRPAGDCSRQGRGGRCCRGSSIPKASIPLPVITPLPHLLGWHRQGWPRSRPLNSPRLTGRMPRPRRPRRACSSLMLTQATRGLATMRRRRRTVSSTSAAAASAPATTSPIVAVVIPPQSAAGGGCGARQRSKPAPGRPAPAGRRRGASQARPQDTLPCSG